MENYCLERSVTTQISRLKTLDFKKTKNKKTKKNLNVSSFVSMIMLVSYWRCFTRNLVIHPLFFLILVKIVGKRKPSKKNPKFRNTKRMPSTVLQLF